MLDLQKENLSVMRFIVFLCTMMCIVPASAKSYSVTSPSGKLGMDVVVDKDIRWNMSVDGTLVSEGNRIALSLSDGRVVGENPGKPKLKRSSIATTVPVHFYRCAGMTDACNEMTLKFKGWSLECRAYDEGVAYRIVTDFPDSLTVLDETVEFLFGGHRPEGAVLAIKKTHDFAYETSFEAEYTFLNASQLDTLGSLDPSVPQGRHSYLPALIREGESGNVLLMETDVLDYPGIFLRHSQAGFHASFPPLMADFKYSKRWNKRRLDSKDFIARIPGRFSLPWRIAAWTREDKDLPTVNLAYLLASPNRVGDVSWIKPGITTWDWWNGFRLMGVDFKCGINTDFYKYHIDFAAAHGLQYILMDEGWYKAPDIMTTIPDIDLEELCSYAAQKGVRIWLWGTAHLVRMTGIDKVFDKYSRMGIAGFKLDFIDGQDQESVRMLTDIAESAARHRLMLDYHGIYKPCGLMRTYPNVLNFEGVFGLEQRGYDMMRNDATIPFIRQVAGPLDYTPGAMLNAGKVARDNQSRGGFVQGTRAHQIGLYFVFDSPFEMMCDSPSRYMRDPETPRFITSIPTVFDETFVQDGRVGEFIVTVRRAGDVWYVGGITDFTARDIDVDLSFLPAGKWQAELFRDGVNADRCGEDYRIENISVVPGDKIPVHLASGGGFGMILRRH